MLQHFEILPFLLGVVVGIVGLLFWKEEPHVVIKYPHPTNVQSLTYKDPNGICYKYDAKEVNCDKNEGTLTAYPMQDGFQ